MNYSIRPYWDLDMAIVFTLGNVSDINLTGLVYDGVRTVTGDSTASGYFLPGATVRNIIDKSVKRMTGTTASPAWTAM